MIYLLLISILLPLILGIVCYFVKFKNRNILNIIISIVSVIVLLVNILMFFTEGSFKLFEITKELQIGFLVDGMAAFFATAISFVWLMVSIYSFEYMKHEGREEKFYCFYMISLASLMAMCYARNLVTVYAFFECVTLFSFPMVMHDKTKKSMSAAMKYLFYSVGGAFIGLLGFFFLVKIPGVMSMDFRYGGFIDAANINKGLLYTGTFLAVVGFSAKAGMFPLHSWLPTAHPVAPSNASSVLSGVITKSGVFVILRTIYYVVGTKNLVNTWVQYTLIILALITIIMGSAMALACKDIKKRLAYSSVSQVSYVLLGLFIMNGIAFVGSLLHVLAHMCIKVVLFLCAGAIIYKTGKRNVDDLAGIGKVMPTVMVCFSLASLGLVGVPPFGGFYSKWFIGTGALNAGLGALGYISCAVLLVSAILTAFYLLPIMIKGFFNVKEDLKKDEPSKLMTIPLIVLVVMLVLVGVFSGYIQDFVLGLM